MTNPATGQTGGPSNIFQQGPCCPALRTVRCSAKPIPYIACHGSIADMHAAHVSRSVAPPEADRGSTRSRRCFYSKQTLFLLEAGRGSTRSMTVRRKSGRGITVHRRQENCRVVYQKPANHSSRLSLLGNLTDLGAVCSPQYVKVGSINYHRNQIIKSWVRFAIFRPLFGSNCKLSCG